MFGKKRERQMMEQVVREHKRNEALNQQLLAAQMANEELVKRIPKDKKPKADWVPLHNNGPVAIAPPADTIQLTPIVQPVPLVPYSSQMQPMYTYDDFRKKTK